MIDMTCGLSAERYAVWNVQDDDYIQTRIEFDTDAVYIANIIPFLGDEGFINYQVGVMLKIRDSERNDIDDYNVCDTVYGKFNDAVVSVYRHIDNHYAITIGGQNYCDFLISSAAGVKGSLAHRSDSQQE